MYGIAVKVRIGTVKLPKRWASIYPRKWNPSEMWFGGPQLVNLRGRWLWEWIRKWGEKYIYQNFRLEPCPSYSYQFKILIRVLQRDWWNLGLAQAYSGAIRPSVRSCRITKICSWSFSVHILDEICDGMQSLQSTILSAFGNWYTTDVLIHESKHGPSNSPKLFFPNAWLILQSISKYQVSASYTVEWRRSYPNCE